MNSKEMIGEIKALYTVIEEITEEHDRLEEKMNQLLANGDSLSDAEFGQYTLLHHLLRKYKEFKQ